MNHPHPNGSYVEETEEVQLPDDAGMETMEFQGKHGMICLSYPSRQPTESELNTLYTTLAEVTLRSMQKATAE